MQIPTITLNNGVSIPILGIGPGGVGYTPKSRKIYKGILDLVNRAYAKFVIRPMQAIGFVKAVSNAFKLGYTLLDNSAAYGNDKYIAQAIKNSGVTRDKIFITTRVSNNAQRTQNVRAELFETLKKLNSDYVDLYQFHWPVTDCYLDTWAEMVKLYNEGYCKAIGVANCHQHHLEALAAISDVVPAINQIEVHPLFTQKPLIQYCKDRGIVVEAYTAIARFDDRLMRLPLLKRIADNHNKSIVQVVLRWHIQNGVIPVVRSLNNGRQKENIDILDFELTSEEIKSIDGININARVRYDPDNCDFSIL